MAMMREFRGEKFLSTSKQNSMIEAIDNMGDVEEEDIDEEGNSTFKQSQPIPVYIPCSLVYCIAYCVVHDYLLGRWYQSGGCDAF